MEFLYPFDSFLNSVYQSVCYFAEYFIVYVHHILSVLLMIDTFVDSKFWLLFTMLLLIQWHTYPFDALLNEHYSCSEMLSQFRLILYLQLWHPIWTLILVLAPRFLIQLSVYSLALQLENYSSPWTLAPI